MAKYEYGRIRSTRFVAMILVAFCYLLLWSAYSSADEASDKEHARRIQEEIKRNAANLLHITGKEPFAIPVEIDVILIGFAGQGAFQYKLDEKQLEEMLSSNHDTRRPVARETELPLSSQYYIDYFVFELRDEEGVESPVRELEDLMKENWVEVDKPFSITKPYTGTEEWKTYSVEATAMESKLDKIVHEVMNQKHKIAGAPEWFDRNVIVVLNPCKRRMQPGNATDDPTIASFNLTEWNTEKFDVASALREEGEFFYYYTYQGEGMSTSWISKQNYVVIDISAGPVKFGQENSPSGSVSPQVLPRILDVLYEGTAPFTIPQSLISSEYMQHVADVRDSMFRGKLAATLSSCIDHLFLNDVWLNNILDMRRIMVPLIVLRNHADFNPLGRHQTYGINASAIQEELNDLVNGKKLIVLESLHSLHQHPDLAVALFKSMTARSEAFIHPSKEGKAQVYPMLKHYIDANVLLEEFSIAADILTTAWIEAEQYKKDKANVKTEPRWTRGFTRTIPVFVLSLKDAPFDLAFQNNELMISDGNMVIVLQTLSQVGQQKVENRYSGFFAGDQPVVMNTLDVQRHILAGLTTALTGIPPPYEIYRSGKGVVHDWMWSTGHTPFGAYSKCQTLSRLAKQAANRNALLGRLERMLLTLRESVETLDKFVEKYSSVFQIDLGPGGMKRDKSMIDILYKTPQNFTEPPLPTNVVREVENMMTALEEKLIGMAFHFYEEDFNAADAALRTLGQSIHSFNVRVKNEIQSATQRLECCRVEYKNPDVEKSSSRLYWIGGGLLVLIVVIIYISIPIVEEADRLLG